MLHILYATRGRVRLPRYRSRNQTGATVQTRNLRLTALAAVTLGSVVAAGQAVAAVQQVTGNPASQVAGSGSSASVTAVYTVDDNNANLTGLGLRIHWNSTKLTFTGWGAVFRDARVSDR